MTLIGDKLAKLSKPLSDKCPDVIILAETAKTCIQGYNIRDFKLSEKKETGYDSQFSCPGEGYRAMPACKWRNKKADKCPMWNVAALARAVNISELCFISGSSRQRGNGPE